MKNLPTAFKTQVNPTQSETLQRLLFENGCKWPGRFPKEVQETDKPYLYVDNGYITYSDDDHYFHHQSGGHTELDVNYIIAKLGEQDKPVATALGNFKVVVTPEQSEVIQKGLFELGYSWFGEKIVKHATNRYIYGYQDHGGLYTSTADNQENFDNHRNKEILATDLMKLLSVTEKETEMPEKTLTFMEVIKAIANGDIVEHSPITHNHWQKINIHEDFFAVTIDTKKSKYRIAPKTRMIGLEEVPMPERVKLKEDTTYYVPEINSLSGYAYKHMWYDDAVDERFLKDGMVFLKKEDAEANAKAIIKLLSES